MGMPSGRLFCFRSAVWLLVVAALTRFVPLSQAGEQAAEERELTEVVRRELPEAMRRLEAFYANVEGSGTLSYYHLPVKRGPDKRAVLDERGLAQVEPGAKEVHDRSSIRDFAARGRLVKLVRRNSPLDPRPASSLPPYIIIECVGPRYWFLLHQDRETGNTVLKQFGEGDDLAKVIDEDNAKYAGAPYSICGIKLSEIMKDPSFSIKRVEEIEKGGVKCYQIFYAFHPKGELRFRDGWVVVCPGRGWEVESFSSEADHPNGRHLVDYLTGAVEYGRTEGGVALPTRVTLNVMGTLREEFVFDEIKHVDIPESEFTLAAYGLPDPVRPAVASDPAGVSVWFYVAAVICLLAAVALIWRSRRPKAA
jgi:hypothetical protein